MENTNIEIISDGELVQRVDTEPDKIQICLAKLAGENDHLASISLPVRLGWGGQRFATRLRTGGMLCSTSIDVLLRSPD